MSPKKKNRPQAAQQLIDSLLDEKSSSTVDSLDFGATISKSNVSLNPDTVIKPVKEDEKSKKGSQISPSGTLILNLTDDEGAFDLTLDVPPSAAASTAYEDSRSGLSPANSDSEEDHTVRLSPDEALGEKSDSGSAQKSAQTTGNIESNKEASEKEIVIGEETRSRLVLVSSDTRSIILPGDELLEPKKKPQEPPRASPSEHTERHSVIDRSMATEIRTSPRPAPTNTSNVSANAARVSTVVSPASVFSSAEASLKQSENLRIAQTRISELEHELERVRRENEMLAAAGETLRRRADEMISKSENADANAKEAARAFEEEKKLMRAQLQGKDRENLELRAKIEEMEGRLEANFKKIRVRERELEHRLEIIKMESATLVSTKDKMILELKRQIDQMSNENDYAQAKMQELFGQFKEKQETQRRVVRALRIALTILEGDDGSDDSSNKSE